MGDGQVAVGPHTGYSGQALSPAGDKGRFVLPPDFRSAVRESSDGRILCLDKHPKFKCLTGFGLSRHAELEDQLDRMEAAAWSRGEDFDRDTRASQFFGYKKLSFDDSGRFQMPDHLARQAGLGDMLYFHGGGRFFTIWEPQELFRMGDEWANAKAACQSLLEEAEAKQGKGKKK